MLRSIAQQSAQKVNHALHTPNSRNPMLMTSPGSCMNGKSTLDLAQSRSGSLPLRELKCVPEINELELIKTRDMILSQYTI